MSKRILFFCASFVFMFSFVFAGNIHSVGAQEDADQVIEQVTPEDLGVDDNLRLPNSPLYFLRDWARGIQLFFTFDHVEKMKLRLQYANEHAIEAQRLAELDEDVDEDIQESLDKREQQLQRLQEAFDSLSDEEKNDERISQLLDTLLEKEEKAQALIDSLSDKIPADALERIKENKDKMVDHLREVIESSGVSEEDVKERLERIFELRDEDADDESEDETRLLRRAEFFERLGDNGLRDSVTPVREKLLERLEKRLQSSDEEVSERLREVLQNAHGDEARVRVLEEVDDKLRIRSDIRSDIRETLRDVEERKSEDKASDEEEDESDDDEHEDEGDR